MELFTIGLCRLHDNGTRYSEEASGDCVANYDNDDIMTFSRAWTGMVLQDRRENYENMYSGNNYIDPVDINPAYRDVYPKVALDDTYIGDGAPLCVDLPARAFLRKGAKYRPRSARAPRTATGDWLPSRRG